MSRSPGMPPKASLALRLSRRLRFCSLRSPGQRLTIAASDSVSVAKLGTSRTSMSHRAAAALTIHSAALLPGIQPCHP